jgi:organic radical activating enzyme
LLPNVVTTSMCPVCRQTIPAQIVAGNSVQMFKTCPEHGNFVAMVEPDPAWWGYVRSLGCTNIYDGYMIDITNRCNLKCKYCYHAAGDTDRTVDDVVSEAIEHRHLAPIILTGGEPTLHPDFGTIIERLHAEGLEVWVLTNGTMGIKDLPRYENIILAGLSFHKESGGRDIEFLETCRQQGLVLHTAFWVIDDVRQIDDALAIFADYSDVLQTLRIKAASNLWAESGAKNHIYTSDMLRYLNNRGETDLMLECNNKMSFANVKHKGQHIMLISWYDIYNVDLQDIDCGPYYRANDGTVNNLVVTGLKNAV